MMFSTSRSLSDACINAKQLDQVHLLQIDHVDCNIDECAELTSSSRDEVSQLQGDLGNFLLDVKSVRHTVLTLEVTTFGVCVLVDFVLENGDTRAFIKESPSISSRQAPLTPALRSASLPPKIVELEPASPSSSTESPKVSPRLRLARSHLISIRPERCHPSDFKHR